MTPRALPFVLIAALLTGAGCTKLPPVEQSVDAAGLAAPYPDLVPTAWLTDDLPDPRLETGDAATLEARGAALRRRAAALRRDTSG